MLEPERPPYKTPLYTGYCNGTKPPPTNRARRRSSFANPGFSTINACALPYTCPGSSFVSYWGAPDWWGGVLFHYNNQYITVSYKGGARVLTACPICSRHRATDAAAAAGNGSSDAGGANASGTGNCIARWDKLAGHELKRVGIVYRHSRNARSVSSGHERLLAGSNKF